MRDSELAAVAEMRPTSMADLARVNGIGPMKIDRYGPALLALVSGEAGAPPLSRSARGPSECP
jgi:DNA helicase-2/ATP-dependent DNA helicase PcrA